MIELFSQRISDVMKIKEWSAGVWRVAMHIIYRLRAPATRRCYFLLEKEAAVLVRATQGGFVYVPFCVSEANGDVLFPHLRMTAWFLSTGHCGFWEEDST